MVEPRPPLVVLADGGPMLFASVSDAEAYLEAIDVERGAFTAYDADGRLLNLTTEEIPSRFLS